MRNDLTQHQRFLYCMLRGIEPRKQSHCSVRLSAEEILSIEDAVWVSVKYQRTKDYRHVVEDHLRRFIATAINCPLITLHEERIVTNPGAVNVKFTKTALQVIWSSCHEVAVKRLRSGQVLDNVVSKLFKQLQGLHAKENA